VGRSAKSAGEAAGLGTGQAEENKNPRSFLPARLPVPVGASFLPAAPYLRLLLIQVIAAMGILLVGSDRDAATV